MTVRKVPQSGAGVLKGDIEFGNSVLLQVKACGKDLRVSAQALGKAEDDALSRGRSPAVVCELDSGKRYWVIRDYDMMGIMDWWEESRYA